MCSVSTKQYLGSLLALCSVLQHAVAGWTRGPAILRYRRAVVKLGTRAFGIQNRDLLGQDAPLAQHNL